MTETLERYKLEIVNNYGDRYIRCEPAPDGSWVMFKDVAALQKRVAELEETLRAILSVTERRKSVYCNIITDGIRITLEGKKDE